MHSPEKADTLNVLLSKIRENFTSCEQKLGIGLASVTQVEAQSARRILEIAESFLDSGSKMTSEEARLERLALFGHLEELRLAQDDAAGLHLSFEAFKQLEVLVKTLGDYVGRNFAE